MQRKRVRLAADVPRDHRHRTELSHSSRIAEDEPIEQPPLDVGQRDAKEGLPAARSEDDRGFLLF
jgi:hypothetical protein